MRVFSFQQIPRTPEMTKKRRSGSGWVGEDKKFIPIVWVVKSCPVKIANLNKPTLDFQNF